MKRNYVSITVACFITAIITGCIKDPLDVQPTGVYTNSNYWRNESDVIAGINGIYNVLTQEEGIVFKIAYNQLKKKRTCC